MCSVVVWTQVFITLYIRFGLSTLVNMSATAEWIDPSTRPQQIENLVSGVDRYNPSNGSILEDYLYHQIRENEYDCLANLAILKL